MLGLTERTRRPEASSWSEHVRVHFGRFGADPSEKIRHRRSILLCISAWVRVILGRTRCAKIRNNTEWLRNRRELLATVPYPPVLTRTRQEGPSTRGYPERVIRRACQRIGSATVFHRGPSIGKTASFDGFQPRLSSPWRLYSATSQSCPVMLAMV